MWTKTQNRLLALALLSAAIRFHAQAPAPAQNQYQRVADQNRIQEQRQSRLPDNRSQSRTNGIPPLDPTAAPPAPIPPANGSVDAPPPQTQREAEPLAPARRATISYTGDRLTIVASNSSLNQILRDVARSSNIKITGGVAEERVFGNYGPGTPLEVLSALLDGTGSNMLLIQGSAGHASELVLSTRTGGPTPPNPNASSFDDAKNDDDTGPPPPPQNGPQPASVSAPPPTAPANNTGAPPPASPGADSSNPEAPSTRTPQQIYDELMKLRRQNQQQPQ
jgi:hypothetical protein